MGHKVDNIDFTYSLRKRKTASLFVERDGSVYLIAPQNLTLEKIENLIISKKSWIYKSIAEWKDLNSKRYIREYKTGESFLYLGKGYQLRVCEDLRSKVILKEGNFLISKNYLKKSPQLFKEFYREKGLEKISKRVTYYKNKMGVKPKDIKVLDLGNRWASCTPEGNLNFNWKCMMAPLSVIDYIIVHELAHLIYPNHNQSFWNEVDKILPDYKKRREWLKFNGSILNIS